MSNYENSSTCWYKINYMLEIINNLLYKLVSWKCSIYRNSKERTKHKIINGTYTLSEIVIGIIINIIGTHVIVNTF